jgi:hypothetical protein
MRIDLPVRVTSFLEDRTRSYCGSTRDISPCGLLMHSFAPVPADRVVVAIYLEGHDELTLLADAFGPERAGDGGRGWITRVRFVPTTTREVDRLHRFLSRAVVEQAPRGTPPASGLDDLARLRRSRRRVAPHGGGAPSVS